MPLFFHLLKNYLRILLYDKITYREKFKNTNLTPPHRSVIFYDCLKSSKVLCDILMRIDVSHNEHIAHIENNFFFRNTFFIFKRLLSKCSLLIIKRFAYTGIKYSKDTILLAFKKFWKVWRNLKYCMNSKLFKEYNNTTQLFSNLSLAKLAF